MHYVCLNISVKFSRQYNLAIAKLFESSACKYYFFLNKITLILKLQKYVLEKIYILYFSLLFDWK